MKNDNYHLGQLNRPVSQIDIQRNMVGFVVEGHMCMTLDLYVAYIYRMYNVQDFMT